MSLHVYIHIPYCIKKCRYCGFASIKNSNPPQDLYISALLKEADSIQANKTTVSTLFFGGGTPTLFTAESIGRIIEGLDARFSFEKDAEISIEANPETISDKYALELKASGVNRVSLGVQSFNDRIVKFLGRVHDAKKSERAFASIRRAGFDNINIDLMYAVPTQSYFEIEHDLVMIETLCPEHVSAYMFSPDTKWGKSLAPLDEEDSEQFFYHVIERLEATGINQYEISNFAKLGRECKHNIAYWESKSYIGLGASAVSCMSGVRKKNINNPEKYMNAVMSNISPVEESETLSPDEIEFERKFLLLRTIKGIEVESMPSGIPEDLYEIVGKRAVLTKKGMLLSDEIFQLL
jgi:oxygen-independent coproporphyrinogen-3 oxidase